jgi:hypothetical protein
MRQRSWAVLSLILVTAGVSACGVRQPGRTGAPPAFDEGWTELPPPPEARDGAAVAWAGRVVLAWGGCDPARLDEDCYPTADGFAFDPSTRSWSAMPAAPDAGIDPEAVWTGREALFFFAEGWKLKGVAYDPEVGSWRVLPNAPIQPRFGAVSVWTGSEAVVWGGGRPTDDVATGGAAYDPAADAWRTIADAPVGLNLASGVWTGEEMLVFGSLLDHRNVANTRTSVGAAYDPRADAWRELPPSQLSPQATSAVWLGDRMLTWDYEVRSQTYDPDRNAWTDPERMPLDFSECYPETEMVGDTAFAFFCGDAALYDPDVERWRPVRGGPLERQVGANESLYDLWRFADLVAGDDALFLLARGITVNQEGTPCYGCPGSPTSFWAYRPPAT